MTTAYKGRDALIKISANGGSTFTTVGGVRTNGATINNEPVDITNADSAGFRELLPDGGVQSMSMNVDGIVVDATAFEDMVDQAKDRTLVYYQFGFANGGSVKALFAISSFQVTGTYNEAQTFTAQMESSGALTITAPT